MKTELLCVSESPKGFVVTSGTVFKQIVIWSSFQTKIEDPFETKLHQRLEGHDGVIFALNYNPTLNLFVSASDDRSVRIWSSLLSSNDNTNPIDFWEKNKFSINHVFYGHLSRIWRVVSVCDPFPLVISVGEDSCVYFWSIDDKKLIQRVDGHRNASVWSLAFDSQSMISFSGGSDSSITRCDVKNIITPFNKQIRHDLQPKQLKFIGTESLAIFCATIGGDFLIMDSNMCSLSDLKITDYNKVFQTYSASDVNEDRNHVVLGSNRHRWPVAGLLYYDLLVVGDRCGSVFVYLTDTEEPIKDFRHLHGSNGVTALKMRPKTNYMYSCGRNGKMFEFVLEDKNCTLLRIYRIFADMEWIGNFCFDPNSGQISYIYGFDSRNFVVWDEREQRFIESIDCGGGHRSWDFVVHRNQFWFCYTKQEKMICFDKPMPKMSTNYDLMITKTSHCKKINCCSLLFTRSLLYFVTAGEENTNSVTIELYLFGHISNISAITCCQNNSDSCYMVSVGGRTQLMLWSIDMRDNQFSDCISNRTKHMKTVSPLDPQIRYLDANMCQISENRYLISTACSDSAFRLYTSFNTSCVLRVYNAFESHIITASNDGTLKIWSLIEGFLDQLLLDDSEDKQIELNSVFETRCHSAGINALDIFRDKNEWQLIVCGEGFEALRYSINSALDSY
ncbi:unnamed protein product [Medioppia subpectinata]|uniref:tRNA (34-2'-O)-methyltransferase regulator WDR6 n=1 Tax=Medioppia subpectinata TaxID=1979941 RepID=A0A7R9KZR2_9ACAR|nr:unnamed protein product [Medioppia subpectinata]CAG2112604.1 unnamed protein product [Medioppia subpectinata]